MSREENDKQLELYVLNMIRTTNVDWYGEMVNFQINNLVDFERDIFRVDFEFIASGSFILRKRYISKVEFFSWVRVNKIHSILEDQ